MPPPNTTLHAAAVLVLCASCSEGGPSAPTKQAPSPLIQKSADDLGGDLRPLFWDEAKQALPAPDCAGEEGCRMTLPITMPPSYDARGRPVPDLSRNVLLAGCGLIGARYTARSEGYPTGLAREFWYEQSGALVGTAFRSSDQRVAAWGQGPPESCELTLCDPSSLIQRDPWVPPEHGQYDHLRYCDLADVGLDPELSGDWVRDAAVTENAETYRQEPLLAAAEAEEAVQP
jgi:hypothetical protein